MDVSHASSYLGNMDVSHASSYLETQPERLKLKLKLRLKLKLKLRLKLKLKLRLTFQYLATQALTRRNQDRQNYSFPSAIRCD